MYRFLTGLLLVIAAVTTAALWLPQQRGWWITPTGWMHIVIAMFITPAFVAWIGCEAVQMMRPRRWFGMRGATMRLLLIGGFAGLLMQSAACFIVIYLDEWLSDSMATALASLATVIPIVMLMPRRRSGRCVQCNYQLRGLSLSSGARCPECGHAPMPRRPLQQAQRGCGGTNPGGWAMPSSASSASQSQRQ